MHEVSQLVVYPVVSRCTVHYGCVLHTPFESNHGRSKRSGWSGFGRTSFQGHFWNCACADNENFALAQLHRAITRARTTPWLQQLAVSVADLGGVRGVQMHPPLAASNVFCVHNCTSPSNDYAAVACSNNNQA